MTAKLLFAVLGVLGLGYLLAAIGRWIHAQWFLKRLWRWLSGQAHHGKPITDAGWFRHGQRALTPTGHATKWWHLPRWQRTLHRTGGTLGVLAAVWAYLVNPAATVLALLALTLAGLVLAGWLGWRSLRGWRLRKSWLHPLHLAAHELAGHPRALAARSWITAEIDDGGAVRRAQLALPPGWPADDKDKGRLAAIASAKLGIEAPEASWRNAGPAPMLVLTQSQPPPRSVEYADLADAVERAGPNEIVSGVGKKGAIVKASLALDSPHWAINMGTGGGKSSLAAFWLMQWLRRGAVAMVLDNKWFSHPWLFKDEAGEYDQLPNVAYLSSPEQIHDGMLWLGEELDRRNQVARRAVTAAGNLRGSVGPPLVVLAEELNLVMPLLRQHWAEIRDKEAGDPARSPALAGFGAVSFAGRAVQMHLMLIGQMLTAEVTGTRDSSVKANIGVTAMARYGPNGWKTAVGADVPMPPVPSVLGRIQLVTAGKVRETQTPKPDFLLYRELVLAGDVTPCPAGMPGARQMAVLGSRQLGNGAPEQGIVLGHPPVAGVPGARVTLREAVDQGITHRRLETLQRASTREPGFPVKAGQRGMAAEYDAVALAQYEAAR